MGCLNLKIESTNLTKCPPNCNIILLNTFEVILPRITHEFFWSESGDTFSVSSQINFASKCSVNSVQICVFSETMSLQC